MDYFGAKFKKAFTLTEVAIVIAVISVIIAILIPSFTSLIKSAEYSNDKITIKYINDILYTSEATNGKPDNVIEAFNSLYDYGYTSDNFTLNDGQLIYDTESNSMSIYSSDFMTVLYPEVVASNTISATYYACNTQSDLCVIGTDDIDSAVNAGFTQFYLYSTENIITVNTTSTVTLWIYTEINDVTIVAKNAYVYHNKSTANCTSSRYESFTDSSYNFDYSDTTADSSSNISTEESSSFDSTDSSFYDNSYSSEDNSGTDDSSYIDTGNNDDSSSMDASSSVDSSDTDDSSFDGNSDTDDSNYDESSDTSSETSEKEAHVHKYTKCQIINEPTCLQEGLKRLYCDCGEYIEETISKLEHEYATTIAEATVDKQGYTTYTCTLCGYNYDDDFTDYLYTKELIFNKSDDGTYYAVTGISSTSVTDIYIPSYYKSADDSEYLPVKVIGDNAFYGNTSITTVTIGCTIETIGNYAFFLCTALKKINIPNALKTFGTECFSRCSNLSEIIYEAINASDLEEGNIFEQAGVNSKDLTVYITKDVEYIPGNLFNATEISMNACITSIIFEENSVCTKIAKGAFYNVLNLKTIVFPTSVTTISDSSSFDNTSGVSIYYMGTETQWKDSGLSTKKFACNADAIYFYSETSEDGCWYYNDDGDITLW